MKLNLGCGRIQFPLVRGEEKYGEHTSHLPESVYAPGWVNVDKYALPGVQEAVDLFRFPWVRSSNGSPFNDSSVDEIFASHLVEHIPHQVRWARDLPRQVAGDYAAQIDDLDGFFVFFYECWRVLKPGGAMHVRAPMGMGAAAITDPTHTRYLTAGSFLYLCDDNRDGAPFDYRLPMLFEMELPYELHFTRHWQARVQNYTDAGINELLETQFNVADEIRLTLRAVKSE